MGTGEFNTRGLKHPGGYGYFRYRIFHFQLDLKGVELIQLATVKYKLATTATCNQVH